MSTKAFTAKVFRWLHQVNEDVELPASAAKVAIRLSRDFNEEQGGKAWSACKTMGDDIGLSERHVIRAIRALEARGHLRVQWGKQGSSLDARPRARPFRRHKTGTRASFRARENRHFRQQKTGICGHLRS